MRVAKRQVREGLTKLAVAGSGTSSIYWQLRGGLFSARVAVSLSAAALLASGCAANSVSSSGALPPRTEMRRPANSNHEVQPRVTVASWYGPGFNGRRTSSGEVFNQNRLTAASRDLPLGSRVRVTNLANGRSVVVLVNDRGPYVRGRGIDLSKRAAEDLGIERAGVARVEIASADSPAAKPLWSGRVKVTRWRGPRRRYYRSSRSSHPARSGVSGRHRHRRYRQYASRSNHRIINDPVGTWLLQMVR